MTNPFQKRTENMRAFINIARETVDDKTASIMPQLYEKLKEDGALIKSGTRINWNNTLKRATIDLWDRQEYNPENAPTLWEDIMYKAGIRIIPEVITAGTAFTKDERGWWNDSLYKSLVDANVWTPDAYADGWELVE